MPTKMHPLGKQRPVKGTISLILRDNVKSTYYMPGDIAIFREKHPFQVCTKKQLKNISESTLKHTHKIKVADMEFNTLTLKQVTVPSSHAPSSLAEKLNDIISSPVSIQNVWPSRLTKIETRTFYVPSIVPQVESLKRFVVTPVKSRVYHIPGVRPTANKLKKTENGGCSWWRAYARAWPSYFDRILRSENVDTIYSKQVRAGAHAFIIYGLEGGEENTEGDIIHFRTPIFRRSP